MIENHHVNEVRNAHVQGHNLTNFTTFEFVTVFKISND